MPENKTHTPPHQTVDIDLKDRKLARDVTLLLECLSSMQEVLGCIPRCGVHTCNPSTLEVEWRLEGHSSRSSLMPSKFKAA